MLRDALLVLLSLLTVMAGEVRAASEDEVEAARKQGMQYLLDSQLSDGSWEYASHEIGITSLCALALIENGVPVDDPVIEKAQRYVLDNYLDKKGTYDIALSILLLSRVGDRDNKGAIRDLAARLIAGQNTHGGWGYSCPDVRAAYLTGGGERPARPAGPGDNSCTQFATLGLWVASRSGVNIDDTMAQVAYRFVMDQNSDGGWPYKSDPGMPQASRNSMTFAGLFCL
ncbi:MAG: prenyltransferase/squalene oxidase repeat-containing protein, partial [Planctomycetaceae bacterium]